MKLSDESIMQFGKFQGEKLEDVPAWWLLYMEPLLKKDKWRSPFKNSLLEYIEENKDALDKEASSK